MRLAAWLFLFATAALAAPEEARFTFLERPAIPPYRAAQGAPLYQQLENPAWLVQLGGQHPPFTAFAGSGHSWVMPYDIPAADSGTLEILWTVPPGTPVFVEDRQLPGPRVRVNVVYRQVEDRLELEAIAPRGGPLLRAGLPHRPGSPFPWLPALVSPAPGEYAVEIWQNDRLLLREEYIQKELVIETTVDDEGQSLLVTNRGLWSDGTPAASLSWNLAVGGATEPQTLSGLGQALTFRWNPVANALDDRAPPPQVQHLLERPADTPGTIAWRLEAVTPSGLHPADFVTAVVRGQLPARRQVRIRELAADRDVQMPGPPVTCTARIQALGYEIGAENLVINWRLEVVGPGNQTVRVYGASPEEAAVDDGRDDVRLTRTWDGRDEQGVPVPAGNYKFRLEARAGVPASPRPLVPPWFSRRNAVRTVKYSPY